MADPGPHPSDAEKALSAHARSQIQQAQDADKQAHQVEPSAARTIGWTLDPKDRDRLLTLFPPAYADVVADHVTLEHKAPTHRPLPPVVEGRVVGRIDDGQGLQALVVSIGGTTDRPDGGVYHITWSLRADRTAVQSNTALAQHGWSPVGKEVDIRLTPAAF